MRLAPAIALMFLPLITLGGQPDASPSSAEILKQADALAQAGRWIQCFDKVTQAITKAHQDFTVFLQGLTPNPKLTTVEHDIAAYVNSKYLPVFSYGVSLVIRAPPSDVKVTGEAAKTSAYIVLNGKSVSRDVVARYLKTGTLKPPPLVTLQQVQSRLPPNSVLVEYFRYKQFQTFDSFLQRNGDEAYIACASLRSGATFHAFVGTDKEIDSLITTIYKRLDNFDPTNTKQNFYDISQFNNLMRKLNEKLLGGFPNAAGINDVTSRWLLSPTADIWLVPFPALPADNNSYAIERHPISYEISGRDILSDNFIAHKGNKAFIMGRPDFAATLLPPLDRRLTTTTSRDHDARHSPHAPLQHQRSLLELQGASAILSALPYDLSGQSSSAAGKPDSTIMIACGGPQLLPGPCYPGYCPFYFPPPCLRPPLWRPYPPPFHFPQSPMPNERAKVSLLGGELAPYYEPLVGDIELLPKTIASILKIPGTADQNVTMFLDEKAQENSFIATFSRTGLKQHFDVIVLITHGFFLHSDPVADEANKPTQDSVKSRFLFANPNPLMRCGLVLAGYNTRPSRIRQPELIVPGKNDGILTANEIVKECRFSSNTSRDADRTDLVALITCLAGHEVTDGDSVASLRFAMTSAGSRMVLAPGWTINPDTAAEIMEQFFVLRQASADNIIALQKAQQNYLKMHKGTEKSHPYYWSTFSLTH